MQGFYEIIICPNCGSHEEAFVRYGNLWNTYIQECENCEYLITETEWNKAS